MLEARATVERMAEALAGLLEVSEQAIASGDWTVDGACDPDSALASTRAALAAYHGDTK